MAQGKKTRGKKETSEDEGPLMVDVRGGFMKLYEAERLTNFFINAIHAELGEHPVIKAHEEWSELVNKADSALFKLYESIGRQVFDIIHPGERLRDQPGNGQGGA